MDRQRLSEAMRAHAEDDPRVQVAWFGGSDATGRTDAFSDLDPVFVAHAADIEGVFDGIEELIRSTVGILAAYRFPPPTPHGHEQSLYLGERIPASLGIDLVVMDVATPEPERLIEIERHGHAVVMVDRAGWFDRPVRIDPLAHRRRIDVHLAGMSGLHPHLVPLIRKAIERGDWMDAWSKYQARLLRPLCDVMRIRHDPDRFDFGFRYLDRDLPEDERRLLERLAFVATPESLASLAEEARIELEDRLARLGHPVRGRA